MRTAPLSAVAAELQLGPSRFCPRCRGSFANDVATCPNDRTALVVDRTGEVIADAYALRRLIGVGSLGSTIWEATQLALGRVVAVKLTPGHSDAQMRRFERGARIMAAMAHPHIAVVHDFGALSHGEAFLVMERLRGAPLDRLLENGPLDVPRALTMASQLLRALAHTHRHGVVHRDVKPGNVFLAASDEGDFAVKLLDFGIARAADGTTDEPLEGPSRGRVTMKDRICGTPEYMAPEQALGRPVDARVDVYGVGATLFRVLTGALPFEADSRHQLAFMKTREDAPSIADALPEARFAAPLVGIVARALARDPAERYPSAQAMLAEVDLLRR
ncbi:MAG: serine/threonine protein kinase [Myxococcales bacterium]|nr:serine/threonine protein kinase [Myxococcales bacterium]